MSCRFLAVKCIEESSFDAYPFFCDLNEYVDGLRKVQAPCL